MTQSVAKSLRHALLSMQRELALVRETFLATDLGPSCVDPHMNNREWCAVYLNDAWHRFCRRLVISSAILEPRTLSGTAVPRVAGLSSESDVLRRVRQLPGRPRQSYWEPRWHDAVEASKAARFLRVANASQIIAALGSTPSPAGELNAVRNFVAHRNGDTAAKLGLVLTKYSVTIATGMSGRALVDALLSQPAGTGTRLLEWCDQLEQIAHASVA